MDGVLPLSLWPLSETLPTSWALWICTHCMCTESQAHLSRPSCGSPIYTVFAILQENVYYWQSVASRTFHAKTMLRSSNTASAYYNIGKMLLEASFFDELHQLHSSCYIVLSLEVRALCLMGSLFPIFPQVDIDDQELQSTYNCHETALENFSQSDYSTDTLIRSGATIVTIQFSLFLPSVMFLHKAAQVIARLVG